MPNFDRMTRMSHTKRPIRLVSFVAVLGLGLVFACARSDVRPADVTIAVYKTPTCGCCTKWIEHLEAEGFDVEATDLSDLSELKATHGVPANLASCHTALVDGYVIEGHVPASDIARLLQDRPAVAGLAVPEMPLGSPGMEHPDPTRHQPYQVMSFGKDGVAVFAEHGR